MLDQLAVDDVVLVGSSFGGWVAMEMAVRSTARLGGLVLIDALGPCSAGATKALQTLHIFALSAEEVVGDNFADLGEAPDYDALDDAIIEDVARDREAAVLYGWRPLRAQPHLRIGCTAPRCRASWYGAKRTGS